MRVPSQPVNCGTCIVIEELIDELINELIDELVDELVMNWLMNWLMMIKMMILTEYLYNISAIQVIARHRL